MTTLAQVQEYIATFGGVKLPDFVLSAIIADVTATEPCLVGAGHSPEKITLITTYAAAIIALSQAGRYVTSQGAPSGASQGFQINDRALANIKALLAAADTTGCTKSLVSGAGGGGVFQIKVDRA